MSNPKTVMANIIPSKLVLKLIKGGYWSLEIYVVDRIIERSMVFRPMLANSTTKMVAANQPLTTEVKNEMMNDKTKKPA